MVLPIRISNKVIVYAGKNVNLLFQTIVRKRILSIDLWLHKLNKPRINNFLLIAIIFVTKGGCNRAQAIVLSFIFLKRKFVHLIDQSLVFPILLRGCPIWVILLNCMVMRSFRNWRLMHQGWLLGDKMHALILILRLKVLFLF